MQFKEVIGQEQIKQRLIQQFRIGRLPHAILLSGPSGCGKLSMAAALGNFLLCQNPGEEDACGMCPSCKQIKKMGHPDLHFSFPVILKNKETCCDDYLQEWNEMLRGGCYFGLNEWLEKMGTDKKQAIIPEAESDNILRKLSVTSYEGGYKVMIIWQPERLNASAANNLLKFLEEPTPQTIFILVTENSEKILPTILSRVQRIEMNRLATTVIADALQTRNGLDREVAVQIARTANGSYLNALRFIDINDESKGFFKQFMSLMRLAYSRDVRNLQKWAETMADLGRERQKNFFTYAQNMIRENFIYNFHRPELNFMTDEETTFATKFARFINERNIVGFMNEMGQAQRDIEQNVNAKTVLFDFALRVTILIRR